MKCNPAAYPVLVTVHDRAQTCTDQQVAVFGAAWSRRL